MKKAVDHSAKRGLKNVQPEDILFTLRNVSRIVQMSMHRLVDPNRKSASKQEFRSYGKLPSNFCVSGCEEVQSMQGAPEYEWGDKASKEGTIESLLSPAIRLAIPNDVSCPDCTHFTLLGMPSEKSLHLTAIWRGWQGFTACIGRAVIEEPAQLRLEDCSKARTICIYVSGKASGRFCKPGCQVIGKLYLGKEIDSCCQERQCAWNELYVDYSNIEDWCVIERMRPALSIDSIALN